ncbi:hypothetical protein, partial [Bacillus licheniformis]|uniref:hypothetical protein n=1 Tax=Bacillus licheniformis TaxID=1402 RepID=UPI003EC6FE24
HPDIADEQCRPRQKRQPATCNVALVSATGFLTKLCRHDGANRNRQKTVRFPCGDVEQTCLLSSRRDDKRHYAAAALPITMTAHLQRA